MAKPLLLLLLVELFGKEAFLDSTSVLLDASPAVDGAEVDEVERVKQQNVFDLAVERRVRRETWRMIHLNSPRQCAEPMA